MVVTASEFRRKINESLCFIFYKTNAQWLEDSLFTMR